MTASPVAGCLLRLRLALARWRFAGQGGRPAHHKARLRIALKCIDLSAFCRRPVTSKLGDQPPTWRSTGHYSQEAKFEEETLAELEADVVAPQIGRTSRYQILSGTVTETVVGD